MDTTVCTQIVVRDNQGKSIPNVVVYLQPLGEQILEHSSEIVTITQSDKAFNPYITVSQTTKPVKFSNIDNITHHIYSTDPNNRFSFRIRAGTEYLSANFDHQVAIAMGCNIHDWMSGYLFVVDSPYFAKTDDHGQVIFPISELGKYRVVIWHPQLVLDNQRLSQDHDIVKDTVVNFNLEQTIASSPTQKNSEDFDFLSDY